MTKTDDRGHSCLRDAPLDFKGGGEQEVWVRTRFFFPPAWQGKFFYFQYLMGQVFFFFSSRWGKVFFFFFFLIKFVFNTHFQMKLR